MFIGLRLGLIDPEFRVFDGVKADNCSMIDFTEWSYNNGLLLSGSAYLFNMVPPFPIPCLSIHLLSFHLQSRTN